VVLLTLFFVEWLLPAWLEAAWRGQTPGKRVMRLAVLNDDGTPVRWPAALTRNLLRAVDFLPFLYGVGLVSMLANRDFKRLGDLAAGTVVVYQAEKPRRTRTSRRRSRSRRRWQLTLEEQRAVLELAERSVTLTQERVEELAELPTPLVGRPALAVQRLCACWALPTTLLEDEASTLRSRACPRVERAGGFSRESRIQGISSGGDARPLPPPVPEPRARGRPPLQPGAGRPAERARAARTPRPLPQPRPPGAARRPSSCWAGFPRWCGQEWRLVAGAAALFFRPAMALIGRAAGIPGVRLLPALPEQLASFHEMYDPPPGASGMREADTNVVMFGFYIWNNVRIGFQTFAGGLASAWARSGFSPRTGW
jgi:hypothetical protein